MESVLIRIRTWLWKNPEHPHHKLMANAYANLAKGNKMTPFQAKTWLSLYSEWRNEQRRLWRKQKIQEGKAGAMKIIQLQAKRNVELDSARKTDLKRQKQAQIRRDEELRVSKLLQDLAKTQKNTQ